MSNYVWNAALSNTFCKHAKNIKKNTLCILGGPEFPAGTGARKIENTSTEPTYDKCLKYLIERPSVDYFAYCDGFQFSWRLRIPDHAKEHLHLLRSQINITHLT